MTELPMMRWCISSSPNVMSAESAVNCGTKRSMAAEQMMTLNKVIPYDAPHNTATETAIIYKTFTKYRSRSL